MEYDNTNRGALFRNTDKQGDSHADYRGSIDVGGNEYWLSAWLKTSKKGVKYMSLQVKPKDAPSQPRKIPDIPDDIPF